MKPLMSHWMNLQDRAPIAAFVRTELAQLIPSGALTALTFATPINVDPLQTNAWRAVWDSGTPGQFTIQVRGWYLFGASITFVPLNANRAALCLIAAGHIVAQQETNNLTGNAVFLNATALVAANKGDILSCQVYQDSGVSMNTQTSAGDFRPNMWIMKVG